jgi:hypothetical protein
MTFDMDEAFKQTDLHYDMNWLGIHQIIIMENKKDKDDFYQECKELIDIFCLQEMKEIAYAISEDGEHSIEDSVLDYLHILSVLGIDFNLFVLLAGKDYYSSNLYTDDFESSQKHILWYLINNNYYRTSRFLIRHYGDNQKLLETIIEPFDIYDEYQNALEYIEAFSDYPEVTRLYEWAENGFDISGE